MKSEIVFLQQHPLPYFGILALEQRLRQAGFQAEVVIDFLEKDVISLIQRLAPRLIGISVLSTEHPWLIRVSKALKNRLPETKIIVGGLHGMLYPREILDETPVDFVCHSEGEDVLVQLMEAMDLPKPRWGSIAGIAYRDQGKIFLNEAAPLVPYREDAVEDRSIYYRRYPVLAQDSSRCFISGRGCPFQCSFCYNAYLRKSFKGKGIFVRYKSVENLIREISLDCSRHPAKSIFFFSDLFTFDKKWLHSFLERYKKEISVPFACTTKANLIDEDTALRLADAGCWSVIFGIETGSCHIRQSVLKKMDSDEEIIRCGQMLRKHGIKITTTNMFCLPGETLEDALKTVELNIQAGSHFALASLFLPFPGTELTDTCIRNGYLNKDYSLKNMPHSFRNTSVLDLKDKKSIMNVQRACFVFVRWPWTFRVFKQWVRFSFLETFFKALFLIGHFFRYKGTRGVSFLATLRFAWRLRRSF